MTLIFGCTGLVAFSSCGERGLPSGCGAWASDCGGFPCCGARALGGSQDLLGVALGLQRRGWVVGVRGLGCTSVCGIFLGPGLNPCPLHWQADSHPLCNQGSPAPSFINYIFQWDLDIVAFLFKILWTVILSPREMLVDSKLIGSKQIQFPGCLHQPTTSRETFCV